MSTLRQLGDTLEELSDLLEESIVLPQWRSQGRGGERTEPEGSLVCGGGWEISDEQVLAILRLTSGRQAAVAVLTAGAAPAGGERYARAFRRFGVLRTEKVAAGPASWTAEAAAILGRCDAVVLAGPDPDLMMSVLQETPAGEAVARVHQRGGVVAAWGRLAPLLGEVALLPGGIRPGLGLAPGLVVSGGVPPAEAEAVLAVCAAAARETGRGAPAALVVPRGALGVLRAGRTVHAAVGNVLVSAPVPGGALLHAVGAGDCYDLARAQLIPETPGIRLAQEAGPA